MDIYSVSLSTGLRYNRSMTTHPHMSILGPSLHICTLIWTLLSFILEYFITSFKDAYLKAKYCKHWMHQKSTQIFKPKATESVSPTRKQYTTRVRAPSRAYRNTSIYTVRGLYFGQNWSSVWYASYYGGSHSDYGPHMWHTNLGTIAVTSSKNKPYSCVAESGTTELCNVSIHMCGLEQAVHTHCL